MKLNTLNTIIDDIMLTLRNSNIAESESINRIQIAQWIGQYRAMLIKQDIDKGRDINNSYIQEIKEIQLYPERLSDTYLAPEAYVYASDTEIPKTIDFHFGTGLVSVTDLLGNEIQIATRIRSKFQRDRKYTSADYLVYLSNNRIMLEGPGEIEYVNVYGIFEDPMAVVDGDGNPVCFNPNEPYPVPLNLIPTIKQLIFEREFKLYLPVDDINNSKNDTENSMTLNSRGHLSRNG